MEPARLAGTAVLRTQSDERLVDLVRDGNERAFEEIDGVETPPQALERGERLRAVFAAVQDLPERQRDALVLQALEGRSYEEIAAELGVSGGALPRVAKRPPTTLRSGPT